MITYVYCVLDSKGGFFGTPFFEQSDAAAIRVFKDAVLEKGNPNNLWARHPEDFSLYLIDEHQNH